MRNFGIYAPLFYTPFRNKIAKQFYGANTNTNTNILLAQTQLQ